MITWIFPSVNQAGSIIAHSDSDRIRIIQMPHSGPHSSLKLHRPTGTSPRLFARVSGGRLHTQPVAGTRLDFRRSATTGLGSSPIVFRSVSL